MIHFVVIRVVNAEAVSQFGFRGAAQLAGVLVAPANLSLEVSAKARGVFSRGHAAEPARVFRAGNRFGNHLPPFRIGGECNATGPCLFATIRVSPVRLHFPAMRRPLSAFQVRLGLAFERVAHCGAVRVSAVVGRLALPTLLGRWRHEATARRAGNFLAGHVRI